MFTAGWQLVFTDGENFLNELLYNKNFPLDGQTGWDQSS